MEKVLHQRSAAYDRPVLAATATEPLPAIAGNTDFLRDLIRTIVREELRQVCGAPQPGGGSLAHVIREEVQQVVRPSIHVAEAQSFPASDYPRQTYADVLRRPAPVRAPLSALPQAPPIQYIPVQQPAHYVSPRQQTPYVPLQQPTQYVRPPRPPLRRTDVWRTSDNRRLCYHCGEPGHIFRWCPYRELGLEGFSADAPRPVFGQRPRAIEDYLAQQRLPMTRRQSRSPSPRRSSPSTTGDFPQVPLGRSPSPRREN